MFICQNAEEVRA